MADQGTDKWRMERLGIPSASSFKKLITGTGKKASTFMDYCYELAVERLTGEPTEIFQSKWMERGIDLEPEARTFLSLMLEKEIRETGFHRRDGYGASPDGLIVDEERGIEIKCPAPKTHLKYLDENRVPLEYVPQVQGQMLVMGYDEWVFMSYHPDLKPLILEVKRDKEYIEKLEELLTLAVEKIAELETKYAK